MGSYTSLALDSDDYPPIRYCDHSNDDLKFATFNSHSFPNWNISTLDFARDVGWHTSLALNSSNNPHISYFDGTNGDLKYVRVGCADDK